MNESRASNSFRSRNRNLSRGWSRQWSERSMSFMGRSFQAISCFKTMEDVDEVIEWLELLEMESYIPYFRSNQITGTTLLSLNSVELRETLLVKKLKDRRIILDEISYLRDTLSSESRRELPEFGRTLTHLSNERILLVWLRFGIILQIMSVALLRLLNLANRENEKFLTVTTVTTSVTSMLGILYGSSRYYWMQELAEDPGRNVSTQQAVISTPVFLIVMSAMIGLYALFSQETEEAALLMLVAV